MLEDVAGLVVDHGIVAQKIRTPYKSATGSSEPSLLAFGRATVASGRRTCIGRRWVSRARHLLSPHQRHGSDEMVARPAVWSAEPAIEWMRLRALVLFADCILPHVGIAGAAPVATRGGEDLVIGRTEPSLGIPQSEGSGVLHAGQTSAKGAEP